MTIDFSALFGANSSQTAQTLKIDFASIGLSPGARSAESILVAIWLRLLRLGADAIAVKSRQPLVINGAELIFPAIPLTINGAELTINGAELTIIGSIAIEFTSIQPVTINGQPTLYRNPEKHDLYCEISPAAMIYQRGRLERSQKLVISQFMPYD